MNGHLGSRLWVILVIALSAPTVLRAGANVWTGSRPALGGLGDTPLVASYAADPDVVYLAQDSQLFRSTDGGRTWARVAFFQSISALYLDPASAAVFLGGARSDSEEGIYKSTDGGATWTRPLDSGLIQVFAASPSDPSLLYASSGVQTFRSDDGGDTWHGVSVPGGGTRGVYPIVAALVIDPADGTSVDVGGYDYSYYSFFVPFFRKSGDAGETWTDSSAGLSPGAGVSAIAIDPAHPDTIFMGMSFHPDVSVFRSSDGGASWTPAESGLPPGAEVFSLVIDPQDSRTIYAGTSSGVFRTRDAGASWQSLGQGLHGTPVNRLTLDSFVTTGRVLRATNWLGSFELEIAGGAVDVAAGNGRSRVLSWNADSLTVRTLEDAGGDSSTPPEGPSLGWLAVAIADGSDGNSRVLWDSGDGRAALEIFGPSGSQAVHVFPAVTNWSATDVSVGADGKAHVLWTSVSGAMYLATVDASGNASLGTTYGPYQNWTAVAVGDGADGTTRVLWRATDGRFSVSLHEGLTLGMTDVIRPAPVADRAAEDITVGSDGLVRVLLVGADNLADVATVRPSGDLSDVQSQSPGWRPRRISAGPDGLTRLLFSDGSGAPQIYLLNPDNTRR